MSEMKSRRVLSHDDKPNFWKPEKIGDFVEGKLSGVYEGRNGKILQIEPELGEAVQVGVSTQLARVYWEELIGETVRITFTGTAPSRFKTPTRLFDVDVFEA